MRGLNKAYLIGFIGQDPELRTTAAGKSIGKVSLATPVSRKSGDEWVESQDWHRITLWERNADFLARYGKKGAMLAVECVIRPSKWTDRDGRTHHEVNLIVDRVLWLNTKATSDSLTEPPPAPSEPEEGGPF